MIRSRPSRPADGDPTTEHDIRAETSALSAEFQKLSMSSMGGGSRPALPRNRFVKDCCADVMSRRAAASVSAANTLTPAMLYGFASCADGVNPARKVSSAGISRSGMKCEAYAYGSPYFVASCAPNMLDP